MAQIMNSLLQNSRTEESKETTRSFRYDLNQIPYDYTVEVTNRFLFVCLNLFIYYIYIYFSIYFY